MACQARGRKVRIIHYQVGQYRIFQEELFTHSSREKLLVCLHTMWHGQTCHDVSHPYIRDTAHVASTALLPLAAGLRLSTTQA